MRIKVPKVRKLLVTTAAIATFLCIAYSPDSFLTNTKAAQPDPRPSKISGDVRDFISGKYTDTVPVIIQLNAQPTGQLNALFQRSGIRVRGRFSNLDAIAIDIPPSLID